MILHILIWPKRLLNLKDEYAITVLGEADVLNKVSFISGCSHRKMRFTSTWCWTSSLRLYTGLLGTLIKPRASSPLYM